MKLSAKGVPHSSVEGSPSWTSKSYIMSKRKRPSQKHAAVKKPKLINPHSHPNRSVRTLQPLLADCYHEVRSLKDYLLAVLPASSRVRRKRLISLTESSEHAQYFNTTLVGIADEVSPAVTQRRLGNVTTFTQTCRTDRVLSATNQRWSVADVSYLSRSRGILIVEPGSRVRYLDHVQRM